MAEKKWRRKNGGGKMAEEKWRMAVKFQ